MEFALRGILGRGPAVPMRTPAYDVFVHPDHDPGCLLRGAEFLRRFSSRYSRALVLFDRDGCGREQQSRTEIEVSVETQLAADWGDRAAAVVLDPELEIWVWSDSPHVEAVLGWEGRDLRARLRAEQLLGEGAVKPSDPKAAVEWALRAVHKPRSSILYQRLAEQVSFARCEDAAFAKVKATLARWFPAA